ncbi:helix-turn-helix transcriptional regulator [Haladaptatus halobius]|uniref:helix-turn-helix transcriptional regulator n=1 Tax=Haladaptatus halobius TaxID=2884875 RepID=UPI001D0B5400|nr:hypothetical protein [Haladaptatus halobius]
MVTISLLLEKIEFVVAGVILGIVGFFLISQWMRQRTIQNPPKQTPDNSNSSKQRLSKAEAHAQIRLLLTQNGGRMRQKQIVDMTDWSKATVSIRLTEMEADDQLTRLRLGREKIVTLVENELDRSPSAEKRHEETNG